ncbi:MAG: phospholipase [Tannerella sp.]|jgi:hypothetical protein|nr:phospholipase [Tannerella sp.]
MWYLAAGIILLGAIVWTVEKLTGKQRKVEPATAREIPAECCGQHAVCERDRLLAASGKTVEYYDDEELDAFSGMPSDTYSDEATEQFREVLYTLNNSDVAGWLCSLQLRGISLPDGLKDEAIMLINGK